MSRPAFTHFEVTRGDKPCVLLVSHPHAPDGVLVPCITEAPTRFLSEHPRNMRYSTIYARRRALRAVKRTIALAEACRGTLVDGSPFISRLLSAEGAFKIVPCQPSHKAPSSQSS